MLLAPRYQRPRHKRGEWREVKISTLLKMEQLGWRWLVDPRRRNAPALRSPGGRVFDFKSVGTTAMVRERIEDLIGSGN